MYVIVDDMWKEIAPMFKCPGPALICSDSEQLTMALVGEYRGWDLEVELLSCWHSYRESFPVIPSQSRFNRIEPVTLPRENEKRQVSKRFCELFNGVR